MITKTLTCNFITVIIPTYNRKKCINLLFELCLLNYKGSLFSFEIHDSSETDETKKIFLKYKKRLSTNISYYKYCSDISADDKAINAIKKVKTKYFWLMGDGNLVNFNKLEAILLKNNFINYDVLNIDIDKRRGYLGQDKNYSINIIYEYYNPIKFAKKYFSRLTYWGAAIIQTNYYKQVFSYRLIDKYIECKNPWWLACSIFELINYYKITNRLLKLGVMYTDCLSYNFEKKDHWWTQDEKYYIYVFLEFNKAIKLLPDLYNSEKENIIKNFRQDALVSNSYLLKLKEQGILNSFFVKKYKKEIKNIKGFYYKMILFCYIPKNIVCLINKIKPLIKFIKMHILFIN